jgi:teichuronic acid biosynthesis glycosyltransferase TuaC
MKVLMLTSEWPSQVYPDRVPFLVNEVNQLRKAGLEIDVFSFSGKRNPINYIRAWIRLRKSIDLAQYDVVHAEWGQSALLALPKRLPLVVTFRGSDLEGIVNEKGDYTFSGKILRFVSRNIACFADRVIVVSESLSKYLPSVPYTVLPVCLDTDVFKPMSREAARKKLGLPLEEKLVLFASDPDRPEKRFFLAEAVVKLLEKDVKIIVTRNVPHDQMVLYYNACDAMLITSSHEGSPTVVFEALACNLPIVSVNVGDVRQQIQDIKGCLVCERETPEEISICLKEVLRDRVRVEGYSQVIKFSAQKFCDRMKNIYDSCL